MNYGRSQTENYPGSIVTGTGHKRATGRVNDALNLDVDDSCVGVLTCMLCVPSVYEICVNQKPRTQEREKGRMFHDKRNKLEKC